MSAVKRADTKPEMALRRALHRLGVRFRVQARDVYGHPDIVVRKYRVAVFVDGDMWHGNEHVRRGLPSLEALFPTNTEFWCAKIRRNVQRDRDVDERLRSEGWTVLRFWAADVMANPTAPSQVIEAEVARSRAEGVRMKGTGYGTDG